MNFSRFSNNTPLDPTDFELARFLLVVAFGASFGLLLGIMNRLRARHAARVRAEKERAAPRP